MWVKEDTSILVYDSYLEAKILIYSAMTGAIIAKHQYQISGLGVKSVSTSPNGVFIIASFFDNKLKVFNCYTSKEITSLEHASTINLQASKNVLIYKEEQVRDGVSSYNVDMMTF